MSTNKKPSSPPRVRPKKGNTRSQSRKIQRTDDYLAGQARSPLGPQVAKEAQNLRSSREKVVIKTTERAELRAQLAVVEDEIVKAEDDLETCGDEYARTAARVAGQDPVALQLLGVTAAAPTRARTTTETAAPTNVKVDPGPVRGSARAKCDRPENAGSLEFQWKPEPAKPTDEWSPGDGAKTRYARFVFEGIFDHEKIRVRARAIGDTVSAWSDDGVGFVK